MFETLLPLGFSHYLIGGLVIGIAVSLLFITTGLIGGMSTFFTSTLSLISDLPYFNQDKFVSSRNWRLVYSLGLITGALIWLFSVGESSQTSVTAWQLAVGGFIAGFGARMSNGCTSGHGICGIASLQVPSLLAVLIFLGTAMASAQLIQMLGGV